MTSAARVLPDVPATPAPAVVALPEAPAPVPAAPALRPAALATVLLGALLPMIDFFIVNVALPAMAADLHASAEALELVVSGYATAYAVLLVVGGRLGDAFGRRRLFLTGMAVFTLTSLLCGLAPTAWALVAARVLQGASAALLIPQTLSTIQATGDGASRARAVGWFGATGGMAAVVGQVLGGVLVSADVAGSSWRPIFLVNVPIGLVGLVLGRTMVPETRSPLAARPDLPGTVLLAAAVVAVLLPLTQGRADGWPAWSVVLLASAPLWAAAFALVERRIEGRGGIPLLPPSILEHRSMRWGLVLAAPFFAGFGTFMFVYALVTQDALGWSPLTAGLGLLPMAVPFLAASLLMPRLVPVHGPRLIAAGALLQLLGLAGFALALAVSWPRVDVLALAPSLAVMGFGQGWIMPPLIRVVLSEVPVASAGVGSGVLTTTQQVALAVGVATLGTAFVSLSAPGLLGTLHATYGVLAVQALVAVGLVAGTRQLRATR